MSDSATREAHGTGDIRQLIRDVRALLAHDVRINRTQTREILDHVLVVLVDRTELQLVLANVIRNAAGHTS